MGRSKIIIRETTLYNLYWNKNLSQYKIAELLCCSFKTVHNRLKEFGIKFKDPSFSKMKYKKYDFNENFIFKAYLLGFAKGDLSIYKPAETSHTIVVRCHTTDKNQVSLIGNLFSRFGKVTVSYSKYGMNINYFLNKSFQFLLDDLKDSVPHWIDTNRGCIMLSKR